MTSSGTYSFNPGIGSLALAAYSRIGIRRTALLAEHMQDAQFETNLLFSSWSVRAPNLWTVDLVSVPLVQGQATYDVDPSTVMMLDAYLEYGNPAQDRLIFPISRTEYAAQVNKAQQGVPNSFWFDRLIAPTFTLWYVPDGGGPYSVNYYRCTQPQDASLQSGQTPAVPYRFLNAMVADLSHRLARIWAQPLEAQRKVDAQEAWAEAAINDVENVPLNIVPGLSTYFS